MISLKDKEIISKLIKEAEVKTHSELIPMVVKRSDDYPAAHFRCAIVVSFIFSLGLYFSPFNLINPIYFLWIQIPGILLGYYLASLDFIGRLFVTNEEKKTEVRQRAIEVFYDHNLHSTKRHNGVLLFISLFEKKIEIITDINVKQVIKNEEWDQVIADYRLKARESDHIEALKLIIPKVTEILEVHFPHSGEKSTNEIANELIIE